jgi:hypothetical protein
MLLSGVIFSLFLAGCWLCCLTAAASTPAYEYQGWPKRAWIVIIAATFIVGAIAWVIARRHSPARHSPARHSPARHWPPTSVDHLTAASLGDANVSWYPHRLAANPADAALARHPAGRSRKKAGRPVPKGPDDDPEFLRQLARRIQGDPTA